VNDDKQRTLFPQVTPHTDVHAVRPKPCKVGPRVRIQRRCDAPETTGTLKGSGGHTVGGVAVIS